MPAIYNQVLVHYLDANGRPATNFWTTQDQDTGAAADYTALAGAAQALTYAAVVAVQFQQTAVFASSPTTGDYQSVLDRAVFMSHIETTRAPSMIAIPAPLIGIFTAGHEDVDMSNPDVIAFSAEVVAALGDTNGHANGPLEYGRRQRARGQP